MLYPAITADPSQRLKALETLVALVVSTGERAATISAVVTSLLLEALTARGIVPAQGLGEQWCDLKQLLLVLGGEVAERLADVGLLAHPQLPLVLDAPLGDRNHGTAAVGGVRTALHKIVSLEGVDQRGHAALGHVQGLGQLGHGHRLTGLAVERVQQAQPRPAEISRKVAVDPPSPRGPELGKGRDERLDALLFGLTGQRRVPCLKVEAAPAPCARPKAQQEL